MAYEYDVFISYRRYGKWPCWVKEKFLPLFNLWLSAELGHDARVTLDEQIEAGVDWPIDLGQKLARSKLLVPLLSRQYFSSRWCVTELAHIYAREQQCGFGTPETP